MNTSPAANTKSASQLSDNKIRFITLLVFSLGAYGLAGRSPSDPVDSGCQKLIAPVALCFGPDVPQLTRMMVDRVFQGNSGYMSEY
jgi:hypothetical protein